MSNEKMIPTYDTITTKELDFLKYLADINPALSYSDYNKIIDVYRLVLNRIDVYMSDINYE